MSDLHASGEIRNVHVVPGISDEGSGPSYTVVRLCEALSTMGMASRLYTLQWGGTRPSIGFAEQFKRWTASGRLGVSPDMLRALRQAARGADIIHSHGLWMMPNVYPAWAIRGTPCRLVMSPRGTLSRWALNRSQLPKRVFGALLQYPAVRAAACLHATAESEYEEIREAGFGEQPVCVIPNGVDLPDLQPLEEAEAPARRTVLFLGRIHPKKGIDTLLRAWSGLAARHQDWVLHIVGSDSAWGLERTGYLAEMKALTHGLGLERVDFAGPLYGAAKTAAYRNASLFVLPTHSENFGMTVAESLAAATPVIVTKEAPWKELTTVGAGWWIDSGVDALSAQLDEAMSLPNEVLRGMGRRGREWVASEFAWSVIASRMASVYRWLVSGGEPPACVRLR